MPEDKAQRNFTGPESRMMPAPGGKDFQQAYNCQAVVDHEHQVIVATRAANVVSDKQQAVVMTGGHGQHRQGAQGGIRRCRLLLGQRP